MKFKSGFTGKESRGFAGGAGDTDNSRARIFFELKTSEKTQVVKEEKRKRLFHDGYIL